MSRSISLPYLEVLTSTRSETLAPAGPRGEGKGVRAACARESPLQQRGSDG
jgi:hypothetical protein